VLAAADHAPPEDREALAELCRAYWTAIYVFIRRQGYGPADAQDLNNAAASLSNLLILVRLVLG
jgi:hypothetical protein